MTLGLIYISKKLLSLTQCWAYKIIWLKKKKSRYIDLEDQSQLNNLIIEIADRS